jgi:uncharacterized membrane protein YfcA
LLRLGAAAAIGAVAGALALLVLPSSAFRLVVPVLILISCALVLVQPWLSAWIRKRADEASRGRAGPLLSAGVCLSGVYGGYFGAAQGVLVIGLLGSFLDETLQRVNGAKNVLVGMVNGTAAVVFIALAHVSWTAVALIAAGSTVGGLLGARFGRRLPPLMLRLFVAAIGVISAAKLLFF